MTIRLQLLVSGAAPEAFAHEGPAVHAGRDPACELVLDGRHEGVSWRHVRIDLTPQGAVVQDLGSTNGTFVNDERITDPRRLAPGDRIRLGRRGPVLLFVDMTGIPGQADTAPFQVALAAPQRGRSAVRLPALKRPSTNPRLALRMLNAVAPRRHRGAVALLAAVGLLLLAAAGLVIWGEMLLTGLFNTEDGKTQQSAANKETAKGPGDTGAKRDDKRPAHAVYAKAVRATVLVVSKQASGAGVLVNAERRLVVAPYHVLRGAAEAQVYFPAFDGAGHVITERAHYKQAAMPVAAKVVATDTAADLAVLELASVPTGAAAAPLATAAVPGEPSHLVSAVESAEQYWTYAGATVLQVARRDLALPGGQRLDCWMTELDGAEATAGVGAPAFNDTGELTGLYLSGRVAPDLAGYAVEVREVRALLAKVK
jgi:pSer/pThr/pTyr-binding forkhead associated (FHA) protein